MARSRRQRETPSGAGPSHAPNRNRGAHLRKQWDGPSRLARKWAHVLKSMKDSLRERGSSIDEIAAIVGGQQEKLIECYNVVKNLAEMEHKVECAVHALSETESLDSQLTEAMNSEDPDLSDHVAAFLKQQEREAGRVRLHQSPKVGDFCAVAWRHLQPGDAFPGTSSVLRTLESLASGGADEGGTSDHHSAASDRSNDDIEEDLVMESADIGLSETDLRCPLTMRMLADPVISRCKHVYSRAAIVEYLSGRRDGRRCPVAGCSAVVKVSELVAAQGHQRRVAQLRLIEEFATPDDDNIRVTQID